MADGAIERLLYVNVSVGTFICNGLKGLPKPYLFPMSGMTEEQKKEYQYITERWMNDPSYSISDSIDWLNKNHFDYRGLIPMELAIDATGKGIY